MAIELFAAAQALDFRDYSPGVGTQAAKAMVREKVAFLDVDRPLYPDHNTLLEVVRCCEVLDAVENEIGALATY